MLKHAYVCRLPKNGRYLVYPTALFWQILSVLLPNYDMNVFYDPSERGTSFRLYFTIPTYDSRGPKSVTRILLCNRFYDYHFGKLFYLLQRSVLFYFDR